MTVEPRLTRGGDYLDIENVMQLPDSCIIHPPIKLETKYTHKNGVYIFI